MDWHSVRLGVLMLDTPHVKYERIKKYLKGNNYTGLKIILNEINKYYGIQPKFISVTELDKYDIVLISLTSYLDIYNLVYTFEKYHVKTWRCKIIIGGSAVVNIKTYCNYGDYFCFGRGELSIHDIFNHIFYNTPIKHNHIFIRGVSNFSQHFQFRTTEQFYVDKKSSIIETSYGCYKNCYFCQYTNVTKLFKCFYGKKSFYKFGRESNFEHIQITDGNGYTTAIDGNSQRLRYAFNKFISDNDISNLFLSTPSINQLITLKLYNIAGYPTEQDYDFENLISLFKSIDSKLKMNHFNILMVYTPFSPEPVTPSELLEANIFINYRNYLKKYSSESNGLVFSGKHISLYFFKKINSNYTLLKRMIINRGSSDDIEIIKFILFDKFQKSHDTTHSQKLEHLLKQFNLTKFYKRHQIGFRGEFSYLRGHKPISRLINESDKLCRNLFI